MYALVTGVQTCALPIFRRQPPTPNIEHRTGRGKPLAGLGPESFPVRFPVSFPAIPPYCRARAMREPSRPRKVTRATAQLASYQTSRSIPDRKSDGCGKSLSVRVDLGGRRHIKKKNN